ncbi:MAG: TRAP transporter TatT component family protein [Thiobacillaceae bacterium]
MTRIKNLIRLQQVLAAVCCTIALGGCSMSQLVARSSLGLIDAGVRSMNQETDLELARAAIPANLKLTESLITELPGDRSLRIAAAQGFYGYAFGFIEDDAPERASLLYKRGLDHALAGLAAAGVQINLLDASVEEVSRSVAALDKQTVPELFWTASNWAKWIDLNRNDPARIADLAKTERLMQRVLELDPDYYFGSPHLFFGVYYGSRPPMLGGDFAKSALHFDQAAARSHKHWLIVEVLRAQFLLRQMDDRAAFHEHLSQVLATEDSPPEMALVNAIARAKAQRLLSQEEDLF